MNKVLNVGKWLLLAGVVPLVLSGCFFFGKSKYRVQVVNNCSWTMKLLIDSIDQGNIGSGRSLTITEVEEGSYTFEAQGSGGSASRRIYVDDDKVWTLCP